MNFSAAPSAVRPLDTSVSPQFVEYRLGILPELAQSSVEDERVNEHFQTPQSAPFDLKIEPEAPDDACRERPLPRHVPGLNRTVLRQRLDWWPMVAATECRYGLPAGLLDAVILQESRYQVSALSPKGAIGLAQLMPGTAGDLGVANPWDPSSNIDGGGRYLRAQLDRFNSVHLGVAAYNAGPGAVRSARGIPQNAETPGYVRRVFDFWRPAADDTPQLLQRTAQMLGFIGDNR
jgi:hypothetical protein